MEGRHVHPSTLYPGGVGTVPTVQLFTDYLVRLMKYVEFMKKVVPLHDDLFDFFYERSARLRKSGTAPNSAGMLGLLERPRGLRLHLQEYQRDVGQEDFVTPGVRMTVIPAARVEVPGSACCRPGQHALRTGL